MVQSSLTKLQVINYMQLHIIYFRLLKSMLLIDNLVVCYLNTSSFHWLRNIHPYLSVQSIYEHIIQKLLLELILFYWHSLDWRILVDLSLFRGELVKWIYSGNLKLVIQRKQTISHHCISFLFHPFEHNLAIIYLWRMLKLQIRTIYELLDSV